MRYMKKGWSKIVTIGKKKWEVSTEYLDSLEATLNQISCHEKPMNEESKK